MNEQPLPMPAPDEDGSGPEDRQLFLVEDDGELDPDFRFDKDGPIESIFERPKSFEELTNELFQQQDSTQPGPVLTREEVAESLRQVLEERQASGNEQPLTVEVARLAIRVRTDAGSMWAKAQRRHEAWSARVAPTLPTLNADGSVASPATLAHAVMVGLGLFFFLMIFGADLNVAFAVALIVFLVWASHPKWNPKLQTLVAEVRRRLDAPKTSPKE